MEQDARITIEAKINRIIYKSDKNWYIIATNKGIMKGCLVFEPEENEIYQFMGSFEVYKGERQFSFAGVKIVVPKDEKSLLEYTASLTKGIGESMVNAIWDLKGENWRDIQIKEVKGFTENVKANLNETLELLNSRKEMTECIAYLRSKGISDNLANKAWERWQSGTLAKVKANPYALAELPRVGFKIIDPIVISNFDVDLKSEYRIKAGILYCVNQSLMGGDSYITLDNLKELLTNTIQLHWGDIVMKMRELFQVKELVGYPETQSVTTPQLEEYENTIYNYFKRNR